MLIRECSDIHTEFMAKDMHKMQRYVDKLILPPLATDKDTTLILAGDIGSMHKPAVLQKFIATVAPQFKHVLYTAGNHEFWGGEVNGNTNAELAMMCAEFPNVQYINCGMTEVEGHRFFMGTMFTDYFGENPACMEVCRVQMGKDLAYMQATPEDLVRIHKEYIALLEAELREGDIVVSHHAPSLRSIHPNYVGNLANPAYASDLEGLILRKKPKIWFHGHMHNSVRYSVGTDTEVINNPFGYHGYQTNEGYNPKLLLEI